MAEQGQNTKEQAAPGTKKKNAEATLSNPGAATVKTTADKGAIPIGTSGKLTVVHN